MQEDNIQPLICGLTLILAYLTSWKEGIIENEEIVRAWKGYDFEILNTLQDKGLVQFSYKAKSMYLTEKGVEKAKALFDKIKEVGFEENE